MDCHGCVIYQNVFFTLSSLFSLFLCHPVVSRVAPERDSGKRRKMENSFWRRGRRRSKKEEEQGSKKKEERETKEFAQSKNAFGKLRKKCFRLSKKYGKGEVGFSFFSKKKMSLLSSVTLLLKHSPFLSADFCYSMAKTKGRKSIGNPLKKNSSTEHLMGKSFFRFPHPLF